MNAATVTKEGNALLNLFIKRYAEVHSNPPVLNRFKEKWGFQDMIKDLGSARATQVVLYYFELKGTHQTNGLLYNYEKISEEMHEREKHEVARRERRAKTKEMVDKWQLQNLK